MKKLFKILGSILLIGILISGVFIYIFRGQIKFYLNSLDYFQNFKNNPPAIESFNDFTKDYKEVKYKEVDGKPLSLHMYEGRKQLKYGAPVILYVHGGSWIYGTNDIPTYLSPVLDAFRNEGYTIISVDYRKGNSIDFEGQVSDIKDAIRFIHKKEDIYGLNAEEIGIIGASAGAHLSLIASYSEEEDFKDDKELLKYPSTIKYIVDLFGPTDLKTLDMQGVSGDLNKAVEERVKKLNKNQTIEGYMEKYSPINYVKAGMPKTLIVHGRDDSLVPYQNSEDIYLKLKENKNKVDLITVENTGHDFKNIDSTDVLDIGVRILNFILFNTKFN